jgi:hypothetical protein
VQGVNNAGIKSKNPMPNCHRSIQIKVKEMVPGHMKNCSFCGAQFNFTGDDGRKVQRALDDLNRTLKSLGR